MGKGGECFAKKHCYVCCIPVVSKPVSLLKMEITLVLHDVIDKPMLVSCQAMYSFLNACMKVYSSSNKALLLTYYVSAVNCVASFTTGRQNNLLNNWRLNIMKDMIIQGLHNIPMWTDLSGQRSRCPRSVSKIPKK